MNLTKIWSQSIRNQLMIGVALVHAVLMTIFVLDLVGEQKEFLSQQAKKQAMSLADSLSSNSSSWVLANDVIGLEEVVSSQKTYPGLAYAMVISLDGRILAHSENRYTGKYLKDKVSRSLLSFKKHRSRILYQSPMLIDTVSPVLANNKIIAWARVGISQHETITMLDHLNFSGIFYTLLAILIGIIFSYLLSRTLTKGLLQLITLAKEISSGNVSHRFSNNNDDEISVLGDAFNKMLDTIDQKTNEARQVLRDYRQQKERLDLAMFGNNDALWDWNPKSNAVYFSKRWYDMLGYDVSEMQGDFSDWESRLHPDDKTQAIKDVNDHFEGKSERFSSLHRLRHKKGHYVWVLNRGKALFDTNREAIRMVGTQTDFTEQKNIQLELAKAKKEALHSAKIKGMFLANMSHEIRTPLNGVLGLAQVLDEDKTLKKSHADIVHNIVFSADILLTIVNDILDISKIEANKLTLDPTPFYLSKFLENQIKLFQPKADQKNIDLILDVQPGLESLDKVGGDITRIQQVLSNLIDNAIKFTSAGNVTLTSEYTTRGSDLEVSFSVSDTGVGISPKNINKIFSPFTQEDVSTTRKFGGTGLGLAISSELVKLMNSRIIVESQLGEGTKFRFTLILPLLKTSEMPINEVSNVTHFSDGIRILLVEDNHINQLIVKSVLEKLNCDVDVANNGQVALDKLTKENYKIVLMDVQMPIMDGLTATKKIRELEKKTGSHQIIIAMTANAFKRDCDLCFEAGMDGFIPKPFELKKLKKMINRFRGETDAWNQDRTLFFGP